MPCKLCGRHGVTHVSDQGRFSIVRDLSVKQRPIKPGIGRYNSSHRQTSFLATRPQCLPVTSRTRRKLPPEVLALPTAATVGDSFQAAFYAHANIHLSPPYQLIAARGPQLPHNSCPKARFLGVELHLCGAPIQLRGCAVTLTEAPPHNTLATSHT